jgi:hypothetical protein
MTTNHRCRLLSFALLGVLVAACSPDASELGVSGAEVRSSDVCQRESRYANGRCDASCPLPDPDCGSDDGLAEVAGGAGPLCIAYRGNGPRIPAHFGATARVLESYGLASGVAGGSSGSVSAFLLESVQMNPHVRCSGCSGNAQALRASLMFKSMSEMLTLLGERDDVVAARTLASLGSEIQSANVPGLLSTDPSRGVSALRTILEDPDLRALVNPEVLELLRTSPRPEFHARDIVAAAQAGLRFEAADPTVFVRPGLLSFATLADRVGFMADFYAGLGPVNHDAFESFARDCSEGTTGRTWEEISGNRVRSRQSCSERFRALVTGYASSARGRSFEHRVDQRIGAYLPALATTAVLEGPAADAWRRARADYVAARPVSWSVSFEDVGIGYFGRPRDLGYAIGNPLRFRDDKTRRARALGQATWREVLTTSPAEPGLSRGVELPDGRVSVGGWSDLQPTLVLRSMGCSRIAYITRRGGAGGFETGMARLLGASQADMNRLYSLTDRASSYYNSLDQTDAVVCADWDAPPMSDAPAITRAGWEAPIETSDPLFTGPGSPSTVVRRTGLAGCTLGVAEAPRFTDIAGHPAESEINALASESLVSGFPDRTFRPDASVTRAELASMIQRALLAGRRPGAARFRDVPSSHWAASAIATVADAGFLRGYSDGTFAPDRRVTREEALVALANGLALTGGASADLAVRYTDATSVSGWAANGVAHADRNGLLDNGPLLGAQRRLRPRESATRAEVVSFIARARRRS